MVARGVEVQTASVREPAARPARKPEMASSTTRPRKQCLKRDLYREKTYTFWGLRHIAMHPRYMEQDEVCLARHHSR